MSWNVDAAIKHLIANAQPTGISQCGLYVRLAINAGGLNVGPGGTAGNYGPNLTSQGFSLIESTGSNSGDHPWTTVFNRGDVVIYDASTPHPNGHAQMYTGTKWISDFTQNGFWVYTHTRPSLRIYRYANLLPSITPIAAPVTSVPVAPGTPVSSSSPCTSYPGHTLQQGSRSDYVKQIQQRLKELGWSLDVDGKFGRFTKAAVTSFQQTDPLLVPDGIVGRKTWGKLFSA